MALDGLVTGAVHRKVGEPNDCIHTYIHIQTLGNSKKSQKMEATRKLYLDLTSICNTFNSLLVQQVVKKEIKR